MIKKVAVITHPIDNLGGILTHAVNLKNGMIENGCQCDIVCLSKTGKAGKTIKGYDRFYGYGDQYFHEMQETLAEYDLLIHEVIPHKTKHFTSTIWQRVFDLPATTKHILIYHDTLAERYKWIADVGPQIWAHVGVQEKTEYSFQVLHYDDYEIVRHPIPTNFQFNTENTRPRAMAPHNWKTWKRMDKIVAATQFQNNVTETYSWGIQCAKMQSPDPKHDKLRQVWLTAERAGKHEYKGIVPWPDLIEAYTYNRVIIDISQGEMGHKTGLPNMNYSMLEGMLHGCLPVISFHESNFPGLPEGNKYVAEERDLVRSLATQVDLAIKEYASPDSADLMIRNRQFVIDNFDQQIIAKKYLELAEAPQRKIMTGSPVQQGGLLL